MRYVFIRFGYRGPIHRESFRATVCGKRLRPRHYDAFDRPLSGRPLCEKCFTAQERADILSDHWANAFEKPRASN